MTTPRHGITELPTGQNAAPDTINEMLEQVEQGANLFAVLDILNATPGAPTNGQAWLVGSSPTGQWATDGAANKIAIRLSGAWFYVAPKEGDYADVADEDALYRYSGSAWGIPAVTIGAGSIGATELASTAVTPGSYKGTDLTVDADGRITAASHGSESLIIAVGDESSTISTGTAKVTFRMPYAFTVTAVRGSLTTAQASGSIFTVDINEAGTTILSTKLTIDNTEKTSTTAATPPVISDASLADDAEMTIDVDQIGDGTAVGLKVTLIGHRT